MDLSNMTTLNTGQQAAADAFAQFLHSDDPYFVISGPAGVGKTYLMNHLSSRGLQDYYDSCKLLNVPPQFKEVHFTATTNKAAEVLETSIGKPVQTIHSFLALKVKDDYRTGKQIVEKTQNWRIRKNLVLFIDECSMIDAQLWKFLLESLYRCKVVFVGDHSQMAPVGEELSLLYGAVSQQNFSALYEPVRNADSQALMDLCAQLRSTVETGIFYPMAEVPGTIDYLEDADMAYALNHVFQDLNPSARVLCYTNERVVQYNDYIRTQVRGLTDTLTSGDVVVVAQAYSLGRISLSVERELTVHSVSQPDVDTSCADVLGSTPIQFRLVKFGSEDSHDFRVADDREIVNQALKAYAGQRRWSEYFDLKGRYLDVRDKAACTVYKSQGSTYDMVFVDLGNIGTSFDPQQVARMLYVAVSRARSRVFFYGRLPNRYHNSEGKPLWTPKPGPNASQPISSNETAVA